jgi:hypothetical protein
MLANKTPAQIMGIQPSPYAAQADEESVVTAVAETEPWATTLNQALNYLYDKCLFWAIIASVALPFQLLFLLLLWTCHSEACPDGRAQTETYKCPNPLEVPGMGFFGNYHCKDGEAAMKVYRCVPLDVVDHVDQTCMDIQLSFHIGFAVICYGIPVTLFVVHYLRLVLCHN